MRTVPGVDECRDAFQSGSRDTQDLDQLLGCIFGAAGHAGYIAAGPCQTGGKTVAHRIDYRGYDDGCRRRGLLRRAACIGSRCQDQVYLLAHQFRCESVQAFRDAVRVARSEHVVLALDITAFAQPLNQRGVPAGLYHRLARKEVDVTDAPDFALLLGESAESRCERARPKRDNKSAAIVHCLPLEGGHYARLRRGRKLGKFPRAGRCRAWMNRKLEDVRDDWMWAPAALGTLGLLKLLQMAVSGIENGQDPTLYGGHALSRANLSSRSSVD